MKTSGTVLGACIAVSLIAVGCGSPEPRTETHVVTTTTYRDDGLGYQRRPHERVYEAKVTSVRAIVGAEEEHCWVEREQVSDRRSTVGGAIAGAVVGGIIGHQIGRGRGQDVATAGGAIAGGAIGAHAGEKYSTDRDVKHCETVASDAPSYWDVTYDFRGLTHRVQMTNPPGRTMTVNANGEPRV